MNFLQYLNESVWNKKKAIQFIADMEPLFLKSHIQVNIIGSVKEKGESENDLDLLVVKKTAKSYEKLIKELEANKDKYKIERYDLGKDTITLVLKPDRKVVDIMFTTKKEKHK